VSFLTPDLLGTAQAVTRQPFATTRLTLTPPSCVNASQRCMTNTDAVDSLPSSDGRPVLQEGFEIVTVHPPPVGFPHCANADERRYEDRASPR
jgi:hypothetical protein